MPDLSRFFRPFQGILGLYTIRSAEDPGFDLAILQHYRRLRADFLLLNPPPATGAAASKDDALREHAYRHGSALIQDIDSTKAVPQNSDLYEIESAIISFSGLESLKQGYQSLQSRYRALAGAEVFKDYLSSQRPVVAHADDIELYRADSLFLIHEIRRFNILIPRREQIRRWLLIDVLLMSMIVLIWLCVSIAYASGQAYFPLLRLVSVAALMGGLTSVLQRIQTIPEDQLSLSLWNRISVVIGPLTAIVFALVLYEIFEAEYITGNLVPVIGKLYVECKPADSCNGSLYNLYSRLSHPELAKLIVWSFIAGFSERFVPDTLNGLIERQKTGSSK